MSGEFLCPDESADRWVRHQELNLWCQAKYRPGSTVAVTSGRPEGRRGGSGSRTRGGHEVTPRLDDRPRSSVGVDRTPENRRRGRSRGFIRSNSSPQRRPVDRRNATVKAVVPVWKRLTRDHGPVASGRGYARSRQGDSNAQPPPHEGGALLVELRRHRDRKPAPGLEPGPRPYQGRALPVELHRPRGPGARLELAARPPWGRRLPATPTRPRNRVPARAGDGTARSRTWTCRLFRPVLSR